MHCLVGQLACWDICDSALLRWTACMLRKIANGVYSYRKIVRLINLPQQDRCYGVSI